MSKKEHKQTDVLERFLHEPIENIAQAYFDDFVKENARKSAQVGLKTMVIRREVGKCCDWCHSLAGEYEYGEQPPDFFRRHDYCKCMVLFKSVKGKYTDVWSKKEFETERDARIARIKELNSEKEKEIAKIKRIAKDGGKIYVDTLQVRKNFKTEGKVLDNEKEFVIDRKKYVLDGVKNKLEYSKSELSHAELITNTIGGEIKMMPKINNPQHIRVPDYMVDDKYKLDLKEPTGSGKNTIYNNLKEVKNQANYVALDVSECDLSIEEIDTYLDSAFHSKHLQFLEGVILIKDNKLIKMLERV